jgi:hypothetical protein
MPAKLSGQKHARSAPSPQPPPKKSKKRRKRFKETFGYFKHKMQNMFESGLPIPAKLQTQFAPPVRRSPPAGFCLLTAIPEDCLFRVLDMLSPRIADQALVLPAVCKLTRDWVYQHSKNGFEWLKFAWYRLVEFDATCCVAQVLNDSDDAVQFLKGMWAIEGSVTNQPFVPRPSQPLLQFFTNAFRSHAPVGAIGGYCKPLINQYLAMRTTNVVQADPPLKVAAGTQQALDTAWGDLVGQTPRLMMEWMQAQLATDEQNETSSRLCAELAGCITQSPLMQSTDQLTYADVIRVVYPGEFGAHQPLPVITYLRNVVPFQLRLLPTPCHLVQGNVLSSKLADIFHSLSLYFHGTYSTGMPDGTRYRYTDAKSTPLGVHDQHTLIWRRMARCTLNFIAETSCVTTVTKAERKSERQAGSQASKPTKALTDAQRFPFGLIDQFNSQYPASIAEFIDSQLRDQTRVGRFNQVMTSVANAMSHNYENNQPLHDLSAVQWGSQSGWDWLCTLFSNLVNYKLTRGVAQALCGTSSIIGFLQQMWHTEETTHRRPFLPPPRNAIKLTFCDIFTCIMKTETDTGCHWIAENDRVEWTDLYLDCRLGGTAWVGTDFALLSARVQQMLHQSFDKLVRQAPRVILNWLHTQILESPNHSDILLKGLIARILQSPLVEFDTHLSHAEMLNIRHDQGSFYNCNQQSHPLMVYFFDVLPHQLNQLPAGCQLSHCDTLPSQITQAYTCLKACFQQTYQKGMPTGTKYRNDRGTLKLITVSQVGLLSVRQATIAAMRCINQLCPV